MNERTVVVIDDFKPMLSIIQSCLQGLGFNIIFFHENLTVESMEDSIKHIQPDLVITDLNWKNSVDWSGEYLLQATLAMQIPTILMSSSPEDLELIAKSVPEDQKAISGFLDKDGISKTLPPLVSALLGMR